MNIGKLFNSMTVKEYLFYMENHKKYKDFNTLGLYRSILENPKLDVQQKLEIRDCANSFFQKTFDFLQIKEPETYFYLKTLGQELTEGDNDQIWNEIVLNQQKILTEKRIKHRNFGVYSKQRTFGGELPRHQRIMLKQKNNIYTVRTSFVNEKMSFKTDKSKQLVGIKSEINRKERKNQEKHIQKIIDNS